MKISDGNSRYRERWKERVSNRPAVETCEGGTGNIPKPGKKEGGD